MSTRTLRQQTTYANSIYIKCIPKNGPYTKKRRHNGEAKPIVEKTLPN
jgi:hypothetical protein